MPTAKDICNQGLGKIGASRVNQLSPPRTTVETLCASGFAQWRDSEIKKRRWTFATVLTTLSPISPTPDAKGNYTFNQPADMLRPIRPLQPYRNQWILRGKIFYSTSPTLDLEYIRTLPETDITDAAFVDVLAWRIAIEMVEPNTQSNDKFTKAVTGYRDALNEAAAQNAFVLDPQLTEGFDEDYSWIDQRLNNYG